MFYIREDDGCPTRGTRRGIRRGTRGLRRGPRKRNQEEQREEEEEEQEEEIRRGLSNIRYVSRCIIEETSLTFYGLFNYCLQMDGKWRIEKMAAENNKLNRKLRVDKR